MDALPQAGVLRGRARLRARKGASHVKQRYRLVTLVFGVMYTVARAREGVRNTSGITRMSPPGAPGGSGEARGVPHLGHAIRR